MNRVHQKWQNVAIERLVYGDQNDTEQPNTDALEPHLEIKPDDDKESTIEHSLPSRSSGMKQLNQSEATAMTIQVYDTVAPLKGTWSDPSEAF